MYDSLDSFLQRVMVLALILLLSLIVLRKLSEAATQVPATQPAGATLLAEDQVDGPLEEPVVDEQQDGQHSDEEELTEVDLQPTSETTLEPQIVHLDDDTHSSADSELIEDEMLKQLSKCSCAVPVQMIRLGSGKYRFSDSKRVYLVRILRSAVMVRVGGGWLSLEQFLLKHDLCRSNRVHLISHNSNGNYAQEMVAFKSKRLVSE